MTNYDVVKKLIGEIRPVGETDCDEKRFENLKETVNLVELLLRDIFEVASLSEQYEYSIKKAGKYAKKYLNSWKEYCDNK